MDELLAEPVVVYSLGLIAASVCTKLDDAKTVEWVNRHMPTGISSSWQLSADKTFRTGTPNPGPCEKDPARRHLLLKC